MKKFLILIMLLSVPVSVVSLSAQASFFNKINRLFYTKNPKDIEAAKNYLFKNGYLESSDPNFKTEETPESMTLKEITSTIVTMTDDQWDNFSAFLRSNVKKKGAYAIDTTKTLEILMHVVKLTNEKRNALSEQYKSFKAGVKTEYNEMPREVLLTFIKIPEAKREKTISTMVEWGLPTHEQERNFINALKMVNYDVDKVNKDDVIKAEYSPF
jgi:hypothetical protein